MMSNENVPEKQQEPELEIKKILLLKLYLRYKDLNFSTRPNTI